LVLSEFVAFAFLVSNFSLESFSLPFPVSEVSLSSVHLAKQAAISHWTTTVMTQASTPVTQLVLALS
jgi:hypothetical protein